MKRHTVRKSSLAGAGALILLLVLLLSCSLDRVRTGTVVLTFSDTRETRTINTEPADMTIASYTITMEKDGRTVISEIQKETDSEITIDGLSAGIWTLSVTGKNAGGLIIAELHSGSLDVIVTRGGVTAVTASLVPLSGEGTLRITTAITGESGLIKDAQQQITVSDEEGTTVATGIYDAHSQPLLSLPSGWYRIQTLLSDGDPSSCERFFGSRLEFFRILGGTVTDLTLSYPIDSYTVGDIGPAGGIITHVYPSDSLQDGTGTYQGTIHSAVRQSIDGVSALSFPGDSYAELGSLIDVVPDIFEVRIWVDENHNNERVGVLMGNYADGGYNTHVMAWEVYTSGMPRIYWDGGLKDVRFDYDVRQSRWIYLRFVRTGSDFSLYVDDTTADGTTLRSIPVHSALGSGPVYDINLNQGPRTHRIGSDYPSSRQPFSGSISDLRIQDSSGNTVFSLPCDRFIEVAPNDLRLLSGGTIVSDSSQTGYRDSATLDRFIAGYYRPSGGIPQSVGTSELLGTGTLNTQAAYEAMGTGAYTSGTGDDVTDSYAASLISRLDLHGCDDWHLPSIEELEEAQEIILAHRLNPYALDGQYFSSTEVSPEQMLTYDENTGGRVSIDRSETLLIRPVRSF